MTTHNLFLPPTFLEVSDALDALNEALVRLAESYPELVLSPYKYTAYK